MIARTGTLTICIVAVLLLLGACNRVQPVYEVHDQPVYAASRTLSLQQIEGRIILAARPSRWRVYRVEPGQLRAVKRWKSHSATVSIPFSRKAYSLLFHSSDNLLEDQASGNRTIIHRRYNHFVRALSFAINEELSREGTAVSRNTGPVNTWRPYPGREPDLRQKFKAPAKKTDPRLSALQSASRNGKASMELAFAQLPDGPLQPEEIPLIIEGRQLYNPNEEGGFFVSVGPKGVLDGVSTQNQADISDSGRWRIDKRGRFCTRWGDRDGGRPTCYRVVKEGKYLRFFDRGGKLTYEVTI